MSESMKNWFILAALVAAGAFASSMYASNLVEAKDTVDTISFTFGVIGGVTGAALWCAYMACRYIGR